MCQYESHDNFCLVFLSDTWLVASGDAIRASPCHTESDFAQVSSVGERISARGLPSPFNQTPPSRDWPAQPNRDGCEVQRSDLEDGEKNLYSMSL